ALKIHFKKKVFLPALLAALTLSAVLVISEIMYPPIDLQIMDRIVKAPVKDAFTALNVDYNQAKIKLQEIGISVEEAIYFEDLWQNTDANAEEVIDLILESEN